MSILATPITHLVNEMALQISKSNSNYALSFPYDPSLVEAVKRIPNRKWDAASKKWLAPKASADFLKRLTDELKARTEIVFCDGVEAELIAANSFAVASIEASKAANIDADIPVPEGLEYMPFQRAGIHYASSRPNTLIADDMGLGKTIQAIGVSNADESIRSILVICPASLRLNWQREWQKWCVKGLAVGVFSTGDKAIPQTDVVVINYDSLKKLIGQIHARNWDLLICDEAHALKNGKAQRTQLVLGKWHREADKKKPAISAARKVFLTGTPILNRPYEAWTLVNALAPDVFKSWWQFTERYCGASQDKYGRDVSGATNLGELQERLRATIMVRRLKVDVLTELPAKRRQVIELQGDSTHEQSAYQAVQSRLESLRIAVELAKGGTDAEYTSAVEALKKGASGAFSELAKIRHETALEKLPMVVEHIRESLESGKVVVFAHHKDVVAKLLAEFPGSAVVTGDVSMEDRQAHVDRFQSDDRCQLFIGNIAAAGVGLTLTASSHVIFAELDWTPAMMSQCEDRCNRIGQKNSVLVQHLVLEGSLDSVMAKRLIAKQKIIDTALDNDVAHEPILPLATEAATQSASRAKIVAEAELLSADEISEIHAGLKKLSAMCDGANSIDGAGFNKIDTAIGHSLAQCHALTPRQAAVGKRLCHKYRRQLA